MMGECEICCIDRGVLKELPCCQKPLCPECIRSVEDMQADKIFICPYCKKVSKIDSQKGLL